MSLSFTKSTPTTIALLRPDSLARISKEAPNTVRSRKRKTEIRDEWIENKQRETVGSLSFKDMRTIYENNTWVRACIDKITTRLSLIPPRILPIEYAYSDDSHTNQISDRQLRHIETLAEMITNPNSSRESFSSIRQKVDRDLLLYDAAAIEVVRDPNGKPKELYAAHGSDFIMNTDDTGTFKNFKRAYYERREGDVKGVWYGLDELIYMIMHPRSGTPYGTSKIETLAKTVINAQRVENYNSELFGNDATPRLAVMFQGVSLDRLEEYQKYWDSNLKGKPHRPILISTGEGEGSIKIEKVGLNPSEMSFKQYSQWMLEQIMSVFNMQPLVLGMVTPNTGKLNSERQQAQFEKDALIPQLTNFAYHFNSELIWSMPNPKIGHKGGLGYKDIYLDWGLERELDQVEQWEMDKQMLGEGVVTINYVREKRFSLPPVEWGNIHLKFALKQGVPSGLDQLEGGEIDEAITDALKDKEAMFHEYSFPEEKDVNKSSIRKSMEEPETLEDRVNEIIDKKLSDENEILENKISEAINKRIVSVTEE